MQRYWFTTFQEKMEALVSCAASGKASLKALNDRKNVDGRLLKKSYYSCMGAAIYAA